MPSWKACRCLYPLLPTVRDVPETETTLLTEPWGVAYQLFNTSRSAYEMSRRGLQVNIGAHGELPLGLNYHKEMWFFQQGGMSPYEVSLWITPYALDAMLQVS